MKSRQNQHLLQRRINQNYREIERKNKKNYIKMEPIKQHQITGKRLHYNIRDTNDLSDVWPTSVNHFQFLITDLVRLHFSLFKS